MKERCFARFAIGLLLVALFPALFAARSSAQSISMNGLQHKTLLLRGREFCPSAGYNTCTLRFDAKGKLISQATIGPFSLSAIYVDHVKFKHHGLLLEGKRVTLLRTSDTGTGSLTPLELDKPLEIEIAANSRNAPTLSPALGAIFAQTVTQALAGESSEQKAEDLASLPLLTPVSDLKGKGIKLLAAWPIDQIVSKQHLNGVTAPVLLHSVDPIYTKQGRKDKINGICRMQMIVTPQGFPSHIRIIRGLPDGLDESSIQALSQYRFTPASKDGKPVAVRIIVEVHYHTW
jgi:hypothetical protein